MSRKGPTPGGSGLPPELEEHIRRATKSGLPPGADPVDFALSILSGYMRSTLSQATGLSEAQRRLLLSARLRDPAGPVRLREDLELSELGESRFLANARLFLAHAAAGPIRVTSAGNLNREFVVLMCRDMWFADEDRIIVDVFKSRKEADIFPLHRLRVVLQVAGLVRKYRGQFAITRRGASLAADDCAGMLQAHLFREYFGHFNLGYGDGYGECPELQAAFPLLLFHIGLLASDWLFPARLRDTVLLDALWEDESPYAFDRGLFRFQHRILRPLAEFGLLETRIDPAHADAGPAARYSEPRQIRKTALFDRFLEFRLA